MNRQQYNGLVEILQNDADQRYQTTIAAYHQYGRHDDSWQETIFESYVSYVDGMNKVLDHLAKGQELSCISVKKLFYFSPEVVYRGENIEKFEK